MSSRKRTRYPITWVVIALVAGAVLGGWGGLTVTSLGHSVPVVAPGCDCASLKEELSVAQSRAIGLQNQLDKALTQSETQAVKVQSLRDRLAEAQDHLDRLGELGNQAALGLGRVALDALVLHDVESVKAFTMGEDLEFYIEFQDSEADGFASDTPELWNQLLQWLDERPFTGSHYFLDGYGDFRNVVFELQGGYLWFQFSDEWALVKIRGSLDDPRGSQI